MSPKERFQKMLAAKPFAEMAAKPEFQAAVDYALLQFSKDLRCNSLELAAANAYRLEGAHLFATLLEGLARPAEVPTVEPVGHLKGNI